MKKLLFLFSIFATFQLHSAAAAIALTAENDSVDHEQEQLQWCFVYSNLLGFNIPHINNPKLYEGVSDWLGTPYRYSGNSKKGIDCSSLVCELYKDCYNHRLSGCASDIFKDAEPISRSELREGDLVFFKIGKKSISHVGIYLGQNRFVHASLQNGVIVSNLDDPYYDKYFYKAGRINP
jgi:lipoprotein Spr